MGAGAFVEPLVVITLLFGGTWVNRNTSYKIFQKKHERWSENEGSTSSDSSDSEAAPSDDNFLSNHRRHLSQSLRVGQESTWRKRSIQIFGLKADVTSPNTRVFKDYFLSRLLLKFPFLVEAWYWALIYWVYQLGRAFTAINIVEGTVHVARRHALELIALEKRLHLFHELEIQAFFLRHSLVLHWINRIYSFIHIPGTIFFLVWLYYYTTTRNRLDERQSGKDLGEVDGSPAGPKLFEARRRTMAICNLLAFIIFTTYPCMPPRLLSDESVKGPSGEISRSYGFVDTVHGKGGESSVWTQNKFCNQYAAMPSLHFGYSLLIGLTVALMPLAPHHRRSRTLKVPLLNLPIRLLSPRRILCILTGFTYSFTILIAIIATANHFFIDAIAGACACAVAWNANGVLLNLLPLEDYFLWCVKIHKPTREIVEVDEGSSVGTEGLEKERW